MHQITDKRDFQKLFEEYYTGLCNFVNRYVNDRDMAEDVVQAVFVKLWNKRESIQISGSLKSYLFTSCKNRALDHLRSAKRHSKFLDQQKVHSVSPDEGGFESADRELFRQHLHEAINKLRPKTREIFVMHKMQGLTYEEISNHLKIPKRTIEYNVYSALAQLKKVLQDKYEMLMVS